ncbi:cilia- and flagella-associated protein 91-like [Pholidichthys leucotaenia]
MAHRLPASKPHLRDEIPAFLKDFLLSDEFFSMPEVDNPSASDSPETGVFPLAGALHLSSTPLAPALPAATPAALLDPAAVAGSHLAYGSSFPSKVAVSVTDSLLLSPLIPFIQQYLPHENFALSKEYFSSVSGANARPQSTHVTVGVQTDYRESESQTDPYSPEYVVQPGTTPSELLQLAALTWGRGLPAGLPEVEMIERARAKRIWEASLPPQEDMSQLDKRRRMMEEIEAKEWAFREEQIQKLQEERLAVLKELLTWRNEAQKDVTHERLNQTYLKHQRDKVAKFNKIHNDYMRSLRKVEAKRKNVEGKLQHCAIDSLLYVPRIRSDSLPIKKASNAKLKSHYFDTFEGLTELETRHDAPVSKAGAREPKHITENVVKPHANRVVEIKEKHKTLKEKELAAEKSRPFLVEKQKPVPHPATPTMEEPPEGEEEIELAVIHLQKLLKGRRVQYEMFKGKKKHKHLIQELRSVHALQKEVQELQKTDKSLVMSLKMEQDKETQRISQEEASQARLINEELEEMFDTLSKELIRLQDERRIHAFVLLAERDRRLREAEESGRRQMEDRRRLEEDEVFRQVVQVHQENVDIYLEDIILEITDQIADDKARKEIHRKAKEVNDIACAIEESQSNLQSEEIVSELVYSFLIPEIERIRVRERVHQKQHKHLAAARNIIQGTAHPPEIPSSTLRASQTPCAGIIASTRVLEEMTSQGNTLDGFIDQAVSLDNWYRKRVRERQSSFRSSAVQVPTTATDTGGASPSPEPMELSRFRLTNDERRRRRRIGTCMYCSSMEDRVDDCPLVPKEVARQ